MNKALFWDKEDLCLIHDNSLLSIIKESCTMDFVWNKRQFEKRNVSCQNEISFIEMIPG
jgi:hypothetical protein